MVRVQLPRINRIDDFIGHQAEDDENDGAGGIEYKASIVYI